MGKWKWLVPLLAVIGAGGAQAQAQERGKMYVTPFAGYGHLRIDRGLVYNEPETLTFDTLQLGGTLGYRAPFGLIVEAGRSSAIHATIFDDHHDFALTQTYGAVGWQVDFADGWHITPRVGRGRWVLDSDDRVLLDSTGARHLSMSGWDNFYEVSLMRELNRTISMGVNFKDVDQEFGHSRFGEFLVRFQF